MDPWWSHKRSNTLSALAWNSAYSLYVLGIIHFCFIFSFFSLPTYVCLTTSMACTTITVFKGSTNNYLRFISVREGFRGFIPLLESFKTNSIKILKFALQTFWDWTCSTSHCKKSRPYNDKLQSSCSRAILLLRKQSPL